MKKILIIIVLFFSGFLLACTPEIPKDPLPVSQEDKDFVRPIAIEYALDFFIKLIEDFDETITYEEITWYVAKGFNMIDTRKSDFIDMTYFVTIIHNNQTYKLMVLYYQVGSGHEFSYYTINDDLKASYIQTLLTDWQTWLADENYSFTYGNDSFTSIEIDEIKALIP